MTKLGDLFPKELVINPNNPNNWGFYKWIQSKEKATGKIKPKYKFCWKVFIPLKLGIFAVCTAQNYTETYKEYFKYSIKNDIDVYYPKHLEYTKSDIGYINCGNNNGLFDYVDLDEFAQLQNQTIFKIGLLKEERRKDLDELLQTKKARYNMKNSLSNCGLISESNLSVITRDLDIHIKSEESKILKKYYS